MRTFTHSQTHTWARTHADTHVYAAVSIGYGSWMGGEIVYTTLGLIHFSTWARLGDSF